MSDHPQSGYVDLGTGHFVFESRDCTLVLDSWSKVEDMIFGPAAWGSLRGPTGGLRICEARPTRLGGYDQVSENEWRWVMPDGAELVEPPPSWPRLLHISSSDETNPFVQLEGFIFDNESALVMALKEAVNGMPARPLFLTSPEGRLAVINFMHPGLV